jgi:anti-sigma factor ChrR (cupin superfamily)
MKIMRVVVSLLAVAGSVAAQSKPAVEAAPAAHAIVVLPDGVEWLPAPASLESGARVAVLEGDPSKPGPFTMRLWMPAGYRIAPHMHPSDERVTVISGTFHVGMGGTFKAASATALPAGTYAALAPGVAHFAWAEGETVIQLNNIGPWSLTYVDAADDPRNKR